MRRADRADTLRIRRAQAHIKEPAPMQMTSARPAPTPFTLVRILCAGSIVALISMAGPAAAQLDEVDDPSLPASPDGFNLTVDTLTGLEWLDLSVTAGRSHADIVGFDGTDELGPGGDFEGFRYATDLEVTGWQAGPQLDSLFSNFGMASSFFAIGGYDLVREYLSYVGCQGSCATWGSIQGLSLLEEDPGVFVYFMAEAVPSQGQMAGSLARSTAGPLTSTATNGATPVFGHFLVRPVPEPAGFAALASGVGLLAWSSRRRARNRIDG